MTCADGRWCTRKDALLGVEGIHVRSATGTGSGLVLGVETGEDITGCPDCVVVPVGRPVMLLWPSVSGGVRTLTSENDVHRGSCTGRFEDETHCLRSAWATDALQHFDTSASALDHQLGASWHILWDAVKSEATGRISASCRLAGVDALAWMSMSGPTELRPAPGDNRGVDQTRNENGAMHARLPDLVPGRSGKAYAA